MYNTFLGNCGNYTDCEKCKCYDCKSAIQCRACIDCVGCVHDNPFSYYKESCNDYNSNPIITEEIIKSDDNFRDDINRRNAKESYRIIKNGAKDILINSIKQRNSSYESNELNPYQIRRQDEIENSVFNMIKTITCNHDLDWNMELIGDVTDRICDTLSEKGYLIYYPSITTDEDGNDTVSDFYGI